MSELLRPDVTTLRRGALLALRASEDDSAIRRPMVEVSELLHQMKAAVATGASMNRESVLRAASLLETVAHKSAGERRPVQKALFSELSELSATLRSIL